jgi:predicted lipoprotein with Yx(FWY)xxD motif
VPTSKIPAFIVVIVLAVAACTGGASPSPSVQASSTTEPSMAASAQASSTTEPSMAASAQASSTSTPVPAPSSQAGLTVGTRKSSLGTFLVGPDGKTLYLFEADMTSHSTCSGACAQNWPPLTTKSPPIAGSGVKQSLLATSRRGDGTSQVVYNGHPLYYFVGDARAGDTNGEGLTAFGAGWDVVSPAGTKIEKPGG